MSQDLLSDRSDDRLSTASLHVGMHHLVGNRHEIYGSTKEQAKEAPQLIQAFMHPFIFILSFIDRIHAVTVIYSAGSSTRLMVVVIMQHQAPSRPSDKRKTIRFCSSVTVADAPQRQRPYGRVTRAAKGLCHVTLPYVALLLAR